MGGFENALSRSMTFSSQGSDVIVATESAAPPQLIMKLRLCTMLEGRGWAGRLEPSGALSARRYDWLLQDAAPLPKAESIMGGNPNIPGIMGGIIMPNGGGSIQGGGSDGEAFGVMWRGVVGRP